MQKNPTKICVCAKKVLLLQAELCTHVLARACCARKK